MVKTSKKTKTTPSILGYILVALLLIIATVVLVDPIKKFVQLQIKKQSFRTFYNRISSANDKFDWSTVYDYLPTSTRKFVSKSQYVSKMQKYNPYSRSTVVHSFEIDNNTGKVSRTITTCLTQECTGTNKDVFNGEIQYIYNNGQWSIPDETPTSKALENSAFIYSHSSKDDLATFVKNWSYYGVSTPDYMINNYALNLDQNPVLMAKVENWIENFKANQNKQVIIQRQIPLPEYNTPKLQVPQMQMPKTTHCYTTGFGQFASVNCTTY